MRCGVLQRFPAVIAAGEDLLAADENRADRDFPPLKSFPGELQRYFHILFVLSILPVLWDALVLGHCRSTAPCYGFALGFDLFPQIKKEKNKAGR